MSEKISEKQHVSVMLMIVLYFVINRLPNSDAPSTKPFLKIVEKRAKMEVQLLQ